MQVDTIAPTSADRRYNNILLSPFRGNSLHRFIAEDTRKPRIIFTWIAGNFGRRFLDLGRSWRSSQNTSPREIDEGRGFFFRKRKKNTSRWSTRSATLLRLNLFNVPFCREKKSELKTSSTVPSPLCADRLRLYRYFKSMRERRSCPIQWASISLHQGIVSYKLHADFASRLSSVYSK